MRLRLHKFWLLTPREKCLVCEAALLLLAANLFVRIVAFRYIVHFLRARWAEVIDVDPTNDIDLIRLSVARAANALPLKSLCLSRSIAAFIMLRRRRIPAVLIAGVKSGDNFSLLAHAWVQTARGAIGYAENGSFSAVLRIGQEPVQC